MFVASSISSTVWGLTPGGLIFFTEQKAFTKKTWTVLSEATKPLLVAS
jgi:hypothetical protein